MSTSTHLLLLIHGMWGNPNHLSEMRRFAMEKFSDEVDGFQLEVLVAASNSTKSTYDGVDWGAERIANEVQAKVEELEAAGHSVNRFSVVGYSLGGLLARYALGILFSRDFFSKAQPYNFSTFATPHLGLFRSGGFRATLGARLAPYLLSRTGEHFYGTDHFSESGRSLLEVMADPDHIFYKALASFRHINIYANAVNDTTVPYITAAFEPRDPFMMHRTNGVRINIDEAYEPLIKSFEIPEIPPPPPDKPPTFSLAALHRLKPPKVLLPPLLQFRFPLNVLVIILLPVLLPIVIMLVVTRLSLDARASRARIRLLEGESSFKDVISTSLRAIEKKMDDVAADILDDPETPVQPQTHAVTLTAGQRYALKNLNSLPGLQKHFAFIDPVRNSHAVIIARDVVRFTHHKQGHGVLQHWVDRFEL